MRCQRANSIASSWASFWASFWAIVVLPIASAQEPPPLLPVPAGPQPGDTARLDPTSDSTLIPPTPQLSATASGEPSGTDALIRSLVLAHLPREYENTKRWGQTKPRWDGLHLQLDRLQLKTKRRWKEVNHGTWTRYQARLIDPERELVIRSERLRQTADQHVAFDLTVDAKLALSGRLSEWQLGVQLYSISADADATVRLSMTCETRLTFDAARFPPSVGIAPRVTDADLQLVQFTLHRISDAHGPLVRKLGDGLHDVLQDELRERRPKLVEKINRTLDKHSGQLRLSWNDVPALSGSPTAARR